MNNLIAILWWCAFVCLISCTTPDETSVESNSIPRSTPERQGMSSVAIERLVNEMNQRGIGMHGLMIVRNDSVVAEGWWSPYEPAYKHTLYSLSKSFTSTAIGFAVQEGLLTVNDRVSTFFPDDLPDSVSSKLAAMEVRHLLTMSSGHMEGTIPGMFNSEDGNWARSFLHQPLQEEPGAQFFYNTGATYMLSAIVQKLTGQKVIDYLTPRLFEPLGIEDADWEEDPKGINVGGYGLRVKTEDIAKLGLVYLNEGVYRGERLLSAEWVAEATSAQIDNGEGDHDWAQGYGYQFWRCRPANVYRGDGAFGQYCIVMPDQNAVIAINSEVDDMQEVMTLLWDILLPQMKPSALAPDPAAHQALQATMANLALARAELATSAKTDQDISGRTILLEENPFGLTSITVNWTEESKQMMITTTDDTSSVVLGVNRWELNPVDAYPAAPPMTSAVATNAGWIADTLVIDRRFVHSVHGDRITMVFSEDEVALQLTKSTAIWGEREFPMEGKME